MALSPATMIMHKQNLNQYIFTVWPHWPRPKTCVRVTGTMNYTIYVEDSTDIITMYIVFLRYIYRSRENFFLRFNTFYYMYITILAPSCNLNPWPWDHKFHNFGRGLRVYHNQSFCFFFYIAPLPPNGAREWYSHKFHNLDSPYHSDASHQNGNNKPCDFHEVKNIKLLTRDGRHTKTNCKGHTSDSNDLKMINNKY